MNVRFKSSPINPSMLFSADEVQMIEHADAHKSMREVSQGATRAVKVSRCLIGFVPQSFPGFGGQRDMMTIGRSVEDVPISACTLVTCFAKTENVVRFITTRCKIIDELPSGANGSTKPKSTKTLSEVVFILTLLTYVGVASGGSNVRTSFDFVGPVFFLPVAIFLSIARE